MKIPPAQIESFIAKLDPKIMRAVLVYGPDASVVAERVAALSAQIADKNDPFGTIDIPYDKLKSDTALLADEMAALSFSGKRKLIRVSASSATSLDAALKTTLQDAPGDNFVVFASGDLTPASSLRKFFETAEHGAALPCYNDDNAGQRRLLQTLLTEKGLRFSPQVLDLLQERLPVDRKQIRAEIDKLQLYLGDTLEVAPDDVVAAIGQSQESSMDEVAKAIASLDQGNIETHVQQLLREGVMPIVLLRSVIRYFTRLHYAKGGMNGGAAEAEILKGLRPPVFFKDVPLFKRHLNLWSMAALDSALQALEKAERECKKAAMPVEVLCSQLFTLLPLYARQLR